MGIEIMRFIFFHHDQSTSGATTVTDSSFTDLSVLDIIHSSGTLDSIDNEGHGMHLYIMVKRAIARTGE